jgi:hypothetical protein
MNTRKFKFKNGDKVREKVTGFEGTITGTAFYMTGCNTYLLTAKAVALDKEPVALWYDEGRLEFIEKHIDPEDVKAEEKGSDMLPGIGKKGH